MQGTRRASLASGFTLVEMLVVIAIIGLLVALLLPAIQIAREAGRRASCTNNFRQIGIALQLYDTAHSSLPPGSYNPGPCCSTESGTTWTIAILPQLELKTIYDQYDQRFSNEENASRPAGDPDDPRRSVCQKFVSVYSCPSDIARKTLEIPETGPAQDLKLRYMPGSYRGVGGRGAPKEDQWWDNTVKKGGKEDEWLWPNKQLRGVLHMSDRKLRPERLAWVKDGLSNTLMVGEYCTRPSLVFTPNRSRRTFWAYSFGSYNRSDAVPQSRTLLPDIDACTAKTGEDGEFRPCLRGWGSFHPGVVNFLLCDGSVKSLPQTMDMTIFAGAATMAGGEFAPLP
jgi:prepilin-type N-terminal cleavage/methylation domain-containing protein/prepilin-type processing-associated H-X9-DG protein